MSTLLVGFDSAWTPGNRGAIVGALRDAGGAYHELGRPRVASFDEALRSIQRWQTDFAPSRTIILLDQPTVVPNATGQRPVENIVAGPVSRRFGGVQPANTSRTQMFGPAAPLWSFLATLGCATDPLLGSGGTRVLETYPVLALIGLGWCVADRRPTGRLPKYNPARRKTFALSDWRYVCTQAASALEAHQLPELGAWLMSAGSNAHPRKQLQDCVDACLCLLVGIRLAEGDESVIVGNSVSGHIIVPADSRLRDELDQRCVATGRMAADWVRAFQL